MSDEKDFAIEHAGYLADAIERLLHVYRWDAEGWRELNRLVYEFRKRARRAATPPLGYRNASEDEPERNAGGGIAVRYRKKPIEIEAVTWYGKLSDLTEWPEWFRAAVEDGELTPAKDGYLICNTLEGPLLAAVGDMIIQGVKGEIYPCKPDIFALTYEEC